MGSKLKAGLILVLVFGLGMASGIAWQGYAIRHRPRPMAFGEKRIAKLKKELKLNTWQEQTLQEIVQDARDRAKDLHETLELDMAKIREDSLDSIHQMLSSDQKTKFEGLRQRWAERRRERRERREREEAHS